MQFFYLILIAFCVQIKFQYLFKLNHKFWYQNMCLLDEKILIQNYFNFKKYFKNYHFNEYLFLRDYLHF